LRRFAQSLRPPVQRTLKVHPDARAIRCSAPHTMPDGGVQEGRWSSGYRAGGGVARRCQAGHRGPAARPLAVLLLDHGRAVSVDRLVDTLWGTEPPARALGVVRQYVSSLRRCFRPHPTDQSRPGPGGLHRDRTAPAGSDRLHGAMTKARRRAHRPRGRRGAGRSGPHWHFGAATRSAGPVWRRWRGCRRNAWPPSRIGSRPTSRWGFPALVPELTGLVRSTRCGTVARTAVDALCGGAAR
jgi:hypothetical protein